MKCPRCNQQLNVPHGSEGAELKCTSCGHEFASAHWGSDHHELGAGPKLAVARQAFQELGLEDADIPSVDFVAGTINFGSSSVPLEQGRRAFLYNRKGDPLWELALEDRTLVMRMTADARRLVFGEEAPAPKVKAPSLARRRISAARGRAARRPAKKKSPVFAIGSILVTAALVVAAVLSMRKRKQQELPPGTPVADVDVAVSENREILKARLDAKGWSVSRGGEWYLLSSGALRNKRGNAGVSRPLAAKGDLTVAFEGAVLSGDYFYVVLYPSDKDGGKKKSLVYGLSVSKSRVFWQAAGGPQEKKQAAIVRRTWYRMKLSIAGGQVSLSLNDKPVKTVSWAFRPVKMAIMPDPRGGAEISAREFVLPGL